ncbi:hypothetical protein E4T42_06707 [Aureobasidium subglaciale]|nr:hypothetical protein E4T42_06707 [Aureobasidium subglaciale]
MPSCSRASLVCGLLGLRIRKSWRGVRAILFHHRAVLSHLHDRRLSPSTLPSSVDYPSSPWSFDPIAFRKLLCIHSTFFQPAPDAPILFDNHLITILKPTWLIKPLLLLTVNILILCSIKNRPPTHPPLMDETASITGVDQLRRSSRIGGAVPPPTTGVVTREAPKPRVSAETKKWKGYRWETDRVNSFATLLMMDTGAEELAWLRSGGLTEKWISNPQIASINEQALEVVADREREREEVIEAANVLMQLKHGFWFLDHTISVDANAAVALMGLGASGSPATYTGRAPPGVGPPASESRPETTAAPRQLTIFITKRAAGKAPAVEQAGIAPTSIHGSMSPIHPMRRPLGITRPRRSDAELQDLEDAQAGKATTLKQIFSGLRRPRRIAKNLLSSTPRESKAVVSQETVSVDHTSPETPIPRIPRRAATKRKLVVLSSEDEAITPITREKSLETKAPFTNKRATRSNKLASIEEEPEEVSSDDIPLVKRQKESPVAQTNEDTPIPAETVVPKRLTRAFASSRRQQIDSALNSPTSQRVLRKRKPITVDEGDDISSDDIPLVKRTKRPSVAQSTDEHSQQRSQPKRRLRARKTIIVEETEDELDVTSSPVKRATRSQKPRSTTAKQASKLTSIAEEDGAEEEEDEEDNSTPSKGGKSKKDLVDRPADLPNSVPATDTHIPAGALSLNQHFKKNTPVPLGVQLPVDADSTRWEYLAYAPRKLDVNNFDWANDGHRHAANKWRQQHIRRRLGTQGFKHDGRTNREE